MYICVCHQEALAGESLSRQLNLILCCVFFILYCTPPTPPPTHTHTGTDCLFRDCDLQMTIGQCGWLLLISAGTEKRVRQCLCDKCVFFKHSSESQQCDQSILCLLN